jgi:hypothetical protein
MARKQQFLECPPPPKTLKEACKIITSLWTLVQELREIVERLQVNSTNSSTPPSQDRLSGKAKQDNHRKPSERQRGAQPGQVRNTRKIVPESDVDHVERHFPDTRCVCGGEIILDADPKDRHQVFDLPQITDTVTEHQSFGGTCPCCNRSLVANLPKEATSGQMGPGLMVWIALLSGHFRMSTRNIQARLAMQWGLDFSTGAISESQDPSPNGLSLSTIISGTLFGKLQSPTPMKLPTSAKRPDAGSGCSALRNWRSTWFMPPGA